jgi:hypothetical protein
VVIRLDALEQPDMPRIRPLPVSVAERMASVPWLRRQSAHELARLMAVKAARGRYLDLRAAWLQLAPEVPAWERTLSSVQGRPVQDRRPMRPAVEGPPGMGAVGRGRDRARAAAARHPQMYGVGYPVMYKATAGQYALWFLILLAFAKIAA